MREEFEVICECGEKYKSKIEAVHKATKCFHCSKVPCPSCGNYRTIKYFKRELKL